MKYCSTCWRSFESGDWMIDKHARNTPTLQRWATRSVGLRREVAAQVLRERGAQ